MLRTLLALAVLTVLIVGAADRGPDSGETATNPASAACHPSYEGACLDPASYDYDCEGGSGDGPGYTGAVRVVGDDPFALDRDGDGWACELRW